MKISINDLMTQTGVNFGTSGVRGLVADMSDKVCVAYVTAFLKHLDESQVIEKSSLVGIAGDLRSSTDRIMNACAAACNEKGYQPINLGMIPSPAAALYGINEAIPTIMVTGSHIPEDRNGIKFNTPFGEILKSDEIAIKANTVEVDETLFENGSLVKRYLPEKLNLAQDEYLSRYLSLFDNSILAGLKIGVYQHSSVARDILPELLKQLGAEVTTLGRSDKFVSVDTEAIRPQDIALAKSWSKEYGFDCIVSTDGDADRPLVSDEKGRWLRGDIAGILTANFLNADAVVTPVSSNTALELSTFFRQTVRTKIGSPYVIEAMMQLAKQKSGAVVGYEANGGFLQQTDSSVGGHSLSALPTRDAIIVMLAVMISSKRAKLTISELVESLPQRYTASDRIKDLPTEKSRTWLEGLTNHFSQGNMDPLTEVMPELAEVKSIDTTDGVRLTLADDNIIHFRPSGNAPELRCYTESSQAETAVSLNEYCLTKLAETLK